MNFEHKTLLVPYALLPLCAFGRFNTFLVGFTKLHLSLMRLWMQAMTFADTRVEKGQAEYTKPAKKICVILRNQRQKFLVNPVQKFVLISVQTFLSVKKTFVFHPILY
jgi:hypothetical protein